MDVRKTVLSDTTGRLYMPVDLEGVRHCISEASYLAGVPVNKRSPAGDFSLVIGSPDGPENRDQRTLDLVRDKLKVI